MKHLRHNLRGASRGWDLMCMRMLAKGVTNYYTFIPAPTCLDSGAVKMNEHESTISIIFHPFPSMSSLLCLFMSVTCQIAVFGRVNSGKSAGMLRCFRCYQIRSLTPGVPNAQRHEFIYSKLGMWQHMAWGVDLLYNWTESPYIVILHYSKSNPFNPPSWSHQSCSQLGVL